MKVDEHISAAIASYLNEKGIRAMDLCQTFNVSEGTLSNWRRVGRGIQDRNWLVLFPLIRHYLPQSRIYIDAAGNEQYKSAFDGGTGAEDEKTDQRTRAMNFSTQSVPKFTSRHLEQFNAMLESIEQLAERVESSRIEYHTKTPGCGSGIFALKTKTATAIPQGAVLFASTDLKPRDGGLVIYLNLEGKVDVAHFGIRGMFFELQGREKIFGEREKILDYVKWIFPIVHYYVVTY